MLILKVIVTVIVAMIIMVIIIQNNINNNMKITIKNQIMLKQTNVLKTYDFMYLIYPLAYIP